MQPSKVINLWGKALIIEATHKGTIKTVVRYHDIALNGAGKFSKIVGWVQLFRVSKYSHAKLEARPLQMYYTSSKSYCKVG